jgi:hypothetical protein
MAHANALEHLDAVKVRHHDVEKNEVKFLSGEEIESREAVFGLHANVSFLGKPPDEKSSIVPLVVDDEYSKRTIFSL